MERGKPLELTQLLQLPVSRLGQSFTHSITDSQDNFSEFRPYSAAVTPQPSVLIEREIQCAPLKLTAECQTRVASHLNDTTQHEYPTLGAPTPEANRPVSDASKLLAPFIESAQLLPADAVLIPAPDEDTRGATNLQDAHTFSHHAYWGTLPVSSVAWAPSAGGQSVGVLAAAAAPDASLGKLAMDAASGQVPPVIVWTMGSTQPLAMCQPPAPVMCLAFHQSGSVIAGGMSDGSVAIWRLPTQTETTIMQPIALSPHSESHSAPILSLQFLSQSLLITAQGRVRDEADLSGAMQLATTSTDGQLIIFEVHLPPPVMPGAQPSQNPAGILPDGCQLHPPGTCRSLFTMDVVDRATLQVCRPCALSLPLSADDHYTLALDTGALAFLDTGLAYAETAAALAASEPTSHQLEGLPRMALQIIAGRQLPCADDSRVVDSGASRNPLPTSTLARAALQITPVSPMLRNPFVGTANASKPQHSAPPFAVAVSPFLPQLSITMASDGFCVWLNSEPVLVSPPAARPYTCGCLSPFRAAVLFMGRDDGIIEAWDLLDSTTVPFHQQAISTHALTVLSYSAKAGIADIARKSGVRQRDVIAAGDTTGALFVRVVSRVLRTPLRHERSLLRHLVKRDVECSQYIQARFSLETKDSMAKTRTAFDLVRP